jgi:hypothetical protein
MWYYLNLVKERCSRCHRDYEIDDDLCELLDILVSTHDEILRYIELKESESKCKIKKW